MSFRSAAVLVLLLLAACDSAEPEDARTHITMLVVHSPAIASADVTEAVVRAVGETNEIFENSAIPVRLEAVHVAEVEYEATERRQDLRRLMDPDDGFLDAVHDLRDTHEADVVVMLADDRSLTVNGAVMAEARTAFAVIFWETLGAPDFTLAHELGHLMGARHSLDSDPRLEPFPYGHGFRNDSLKTVMSTAHVDALPYFSSPEITWNGVTLGDATHSDAARVLRETATYVSNFRGPRTPTDFEPPSLWPTLEVNESATPTSAILRSARGR